MAKQFQKLKENFTCDHCGAFVVGDGYTNHCPRCLWSKHVDINPGDRLNSCGGLMKPVGLETKAGEYVIIHQCQKCGLVKKNKASVHDDFDDLLKLSSQY